MKRRGLLIILSSPSGAGKSTLLRCLYGNYLPQAGSILIRQRGTPTKAGENVKRGGDEP